jgi:hypothetical protein
MKTLMLILVILSLSGCVTPVKRNFPDAPAMLKEKCPELLDVKKTDKLSDVLLTVTQNYGQYHECSIKLESWIQWYEDQKKIFDSVK